MFKLLFFIIVEMAQQTDDDSLNKSVGGNDAIKDSDYILNGTV